MHSYKERRRTKKKNIVHLRHIINKLIKVCYVNLKSKTSIENKHKNIKPL